jgi:3',5'-cyclic AMP phosphodiesterase CpdA
MAEVFELPDNGPPGLPPDHNYWFEYASARIAVIDSNMDEDVLRDSVAPWLTEVMTAAACRWRFVAFHHPPYTGGNYACDERIQRTLVPVFEATGVDVVFNGHDHTYQRTYPLRGGQIVAPEEGVLYIVTGAGGANLYHIRQPRPAFIAACDDQHYSFSQVTIADDTLHLRQIALGGSVLDEYVWQRPERRAAMEPLAEVPASIPATSQPASDEE